MNIHDAFSKPAKAYAELGKEAQAQAYSKPSSEVPNRPSDPVEVSTAAQTALQAGLCPIPIRTDGTKRPNLPAWAEYQDRLPTPAELNAWFSGDRVGIALVTGDSSGGLEAIDFDSKEIWPRYKAAAAECGLADLLSRVSHGYGEETGKGVHLLYRCPEIEGNLKLANRPKAAEGESKGGQGVLIETRGRGGYIIIAPSGTDVNHRGAYTLRAGGLETIQTITLEERADLLDLARMFDETPPRESEPPRTPPLGGQGSSDRVGDAFNQHMAWEEILGAAGWVHVYNQGGRECWRRPGKRDKGISATVNADGTDRLFVFSTSAPLDANRYYDKFGAWARLHHYGDFKAAAKDAIKDLERRGVVIDGYPKGSAAPPQGSTWSTCDGFESATQAGPEVAQDSSEPQVSIADAVFSAADINLDTLPPRDWVFGHLLLAGYISCLTGPGGTGKSMLAISKAISVSLGRSLLTGFDVPHQRNVLLLNNEDDRDELSRRIGAICQAHGVALPELADSLYIRSGYGFPLVLAGAGSDRAVIPTNHVDELIALIRDKQIGLVVIDPYVSFHQVSENDNTQQNAVIAILRHICDATGVAALVVAHTRKTGGDSEAHAGDAESMRGASTIRDGARIVVTLARMSKKTMGDWKIDLELGRHLVRLDDGKKNFSPPDANVRWLRMHSQKLATGDYVGVPHSFDDAESYIEQAGKGRQSMTSTGWAEQIERVIGDLADKSKIRYVDICERLIQTTDYGRSSVMQFVKILPQSQRAAIKISTGGKLVSYWAGKDGDKKTSTWHVYRQEL